MNYALKKTRKNNSIASADSYLGSVDVVKIFSKKGRGLAIYDELLYNQ